MRPPIRKRRRGPSVWEYYEKAPEKTTTTAAEGLTLTNIRTRARFLLGGTLVVGSYCTRGRDLFHFLIVFW